ncbi:MAG: RloB family protein [Lachnospiraceae bacterium]|nr:RloB family protein [Lachnospiraceae bacterium]
MRERRTFAERAKVLKSDETKRKFFLVYEGASTEVLYFDALKTKREDVGISPLIELVPIIRSYSEDGWSNPKKILDRVIENLEEDKTGRFTYESLLNRIMNYFYDEEILTTSKVQASAVWNLMQDACKNMLGKSLSCEVSNLEDDCNFIIEYLNQESDIENIVIDISEIIKSTVITYAEGFDKVCLIVDRDKESFLAAPANNQYEYVLKKCKEKGFGFYVTNPCFEFWLLLHFEQVFELDKNKLLENSKVTTKRRYTEHELRKFLKGYTKSNYDAELLIEKIDTAIKNAEMFCNDIQRLQDEVGSNLGDLITYLRG